MPSWHLEHEREQTLNLWNYNIHPASKNLRKNNLGRLPGEHWGTALTSACKFSAGSEKTKLKHLQTALTYALADRHKVVVGLQLSRNTGCDIEHCCLVGCVPGLFGCLLHGGAVGSIMGIKSIQFKLYFILIFILILPFAHISCHTQIFWKMRKQTEAPGSHITFTSPSPGTWHLGSRCFFAASSSLCPQASLLATFSISSTCTRVCHGEGMLLTSQRYCEF